VDVAVVGGGIVGLTTAALLARDGADVVVLEGGRLGQGVSGRTTAKLSSLHGLAYQSLESKHGAETAAAYAAANEEGIRIVAELAREQGIDCDLRTKDNFTYTEDPARRGDVEGEVEAAVRAGLDADFVTETDLPYPVTGAVRVGGQAEFHPMKYLRGLADALDADGGRVFEHTRAVHVGGGAVETDAGATVRAERVVLATHLPVLDRGGHFALVEPERSYCLGVRLAGRVPQGMHISAETPTRSTRAMPHPGGELLILGGSGHRMGQGDARESFLDLARFARERFDVADIEFRWSAHDYAPIDDLPMVGPLWPFGGGILFATGMKKWGMAMGAAGARLLTDAAQGRENPLADVFDPRRLPPPSALWPFAKHNAESGLHFFGDRLKRAGGRNDLEPGEGEIADSGLGKVARYRDPAGELHEMSARCTHLGCIVQWNGAERTWDCPCHGSRYEATGEVLEGPAIQRLAPR
jgi:glycine/D-amino acid oxidase-like deaminating enzyme/nitrite reductase/ring-hydroxylating ferredoxin subunit